MSSRIHGGETPYQSAEGLLGEFFAHLWGGRRLGIEHGGPVVEFGLVGHHRYHHLEGDSLSGIGGRGFGGSGLCEVDSVYDYSSARNALLLEHLYETLCQKNVPSSQ